MANKSTIAAQIAALLADNTAGDISAADVRTVFISLLDNTLNPDDDTMSQAEAEAGTSTNARIVTPQRIAQAIAALAPAGGIEPPLATSGSSITLDLLRGRVYGSPAAPLTSTLTLDNTGAVDFGFAIVWYQGSTDPLSSIITGTAVQSFGYTFTASKLLKIVLRRESSTLITVFSEESDTNQAPTVSSFTLSGTAEVGATLTGAYVYSDAEGDAEDTGVYGSQYRVVSYDAASGDTGRTVIHGPTYSGGSPVTYELQAAEEDRYVEFEVLVKAETGTVDNGVWHRSNRSAQVQAATPTFDPTSLTWQVLLMTPIDGATGSTIISGDIQQWGDQSGNLNHASAAQTTWRPDLVTDGTNGQEASSHAPSGKRLQTPVLSTPMTGNNWTAYIVMKLNAVSAVTNIIGTNATTSGDGFLIQCDPGVTDPAVAADMKIFGDTSISVQDVYQDSLPIGSTFLLKVRCVAGSLDVFVQDTGGSLTQVGSTLTGRSIANTYAGNPVYIDVARIVNGQFQFIGLQPGTFTAQEQTDLETYLANLYL